MHRSKFAQLCSQRLPIFSNRLSLKQQLQRRLQHGGGSDSGGSSSSLLHIFESVLFSGFCAFGEVESTARGCCRTMA